MNNRFRSAGFGLMLGFVLVFIVSCGAKEDQANMPPGLRSIRALMAEDKIDEAKEKIDSMAGSLSDLKEVGKLYLELAKAYEKSNEPVKALDSYQEILGKYQNIDNISEIQEKVSSLNVNIVFSKVVTDRDVLYEVEPGDTLSKIAKKFGTTVELIKASNSLKDDMIRAREKLKVSKTGYKILIDKSQNILTVFFDDGELFKVYRVSTGKDNCTPVGIFKVVNRIKDPVWYTQGAVVPAESPDNILGSRWLGLSVEGYGIHGTTEPDTLGQQVTAGCIRMINSEVEELYMIIPSGTEVTIVD
ncbi:MAG: L,D-transpeptidase family protein [Candidatus Omnitrophica bacterium]|nr:L,D-transpeptidase family protein [Candidatus Omnitrophota bacterium]